MIKFNISVLLFVFLLFGNLKAQINIPVDYHTGSPSINIPIYKITSGKLSVPVSLYYVPGVPVNEQLGNDNYNLGVGWGLNAGGNITRTVHGLPDDFKGIGSDTRLGWIYGNGASLVNNFTPASRTNCTQDYNNYSFLASLTNNNTDSEPDVFSFNFGNFSGSFVFDNNKIIQTLPYQDLRIQPTYAANGLIATFQITTNDGTIYSFSPTTVITMNVLPLSGGTSNKVLYLRDQLIKFSSNVTYTQNWGLTSVSSPDGSAVHLNYNPMDSSSVTQPFNIFLANGSKGTTYENTLYNITTNSKVSVLSSIVGSGISLIFNYGIDFGISSINVNGYFYPNQTSLLTTTLLYATINNRKYLTSVQASNSCLQNPPYLFTYQGTDFSAQTSTLPVPDLPSKVSFASACLAINEGTYNCIPFTYGPSTQYQSDYWGYYNGNGANTYCPNLYVYPNEAMQDRYRLEQIPNYSGTYDFIGGGADRRVNTSLVTAGSLNMITFPTGGNVKIVYESNQYFDSKANTTFNGGGIRVKTIITHDGVNPANDIIKNYTYTGGLLLNRPQFSFPIPVYEDASGTAHTIDQYTDAPTQSEFFMARTQFDLNKYSFDSPNVIYQSCSEIQTGKGKSVYNFTTPATYGQLSSPEYSSPYQWQPTYSRYASSVNSSGTCTSLGMLSDGYYGFPFPTNPNYNFERGLLQSVQLYNETGGLVKETDYQYSPIYQATSPALIYGLTSDFFIYSSSDLSTRAYSYGKYGLYSGLNKTVSKVTEITYDPTNLTASSMIQTGSTYAAANHTLLSSQTTLVSNDGTNFTNYITRFKYPQDFSASLSGGADSATVAIQTLQNNFMNSSVIEKTSSIIKPGQSEVVIGSILNIYKCFSSSNSSLVLPYKVFNFQTNTAVTNFTPASVNGSFQFSGDSRYRLTNSYLDYNTVSNLYSENDGHHNLKSKLYDLTGALPVANITNAMANQTVYSNFDDEYPGNLVGPTPYSFDHTLNGRSDYTIIPGRVGNAMSVVSGFSFLKNGVQKGVGNFYAFSCWVMASAAGKMTITLTDANGNTDTQNIIYSNTSDVWTYCRALIPVSNLNSSFNIVAQTNVAVVVDDILFCPALAKVSLSSYQSLLKIADTDPLGNTTFFYYDYMGRLTLIKDQYQNILKQITYNYNINYVLSPYFILPSSAPVNTSVSIGSPPAPCTPTGITYNWTFGDGTSLSNGGSNPSHTYTTAGAMQVTCQLTSPIYGTASYSRTINILSPQLEFNLYACGIVLYNVCANQAEYWGSTPTGICTGGSLGTNTFTAIPTQDCSNGAVSTYSWSMAYDTAPSTWISLPGNSNSVTVTLALSPSGTVNVSQSYTLRCTMVPSCAAQAATQTYHIGFVAPTCTHN